MKFIVVDHGDSSVGIWPSEYEVTLPNPGLENEEWQEICEKVLKELYDDCSKIDVYEFEQYQKLLDSWIISEETKQEGE